MAHFFSSMGTGNFPLSSQNMWIIPIPNAYRQGIYHIGKPSCASLIFSKKWVDKNTQVCSGDQIQILESKQRPTSARPDFRMEVWLPGHEVPIQNARLQEMFLT
jgi:hypothetical protein